VDSSGAASRKLVIDFEMYLTTFEKTLLLELPKYENVPNLVDDWLKDYEIKIDLTKKEIWLHFYNSNLGSSPNPNGLMREHFNPLKRKICELCFLLKKLEDAQLIRFEEMSNMAPQPTKTYGSADTSLPGVAFKLPDDKTIALISKCFIKWYRLSPEFNVFVRRKYRLPDEWRFQRQIRIAIATLVLSVLIGLVNLWLNFERYRKQKTNVPRPNANKNHAILELNERVQNKSPGESKRGLLKTSKSPNNKSHKPTH